MSQRLPTKSELIELWPFLSERERAEMEALTAPSLKLDLEKPPEWFHAGQLEAWNAEERFVLALAGTQAGKTVSGPHLLIREIQRCGPGDYLIAGPSLMLLRKKVLPEFSRVFCREYGLGNEVKSPDHKFEVSREGEILLFGCPQEQPTTIFTGHGDDPDTLESMTLKAAVLDECGQSRFKLLSWEAILRRVAIHQGRVFLLTTPYEVNWLKTEVHDRAVAGEPGYKLVRYESIMNPTFTRAEWDDRRRKMPAWRFDLFYRAIFTRPAGAVFDTFETKRDTYKRFAIPDDWPRAIGVDFGPLNTAAVKVAMDPQTLDHPDGPLCYVYKSYHRGGVETQDHVREILIYSKSQGGGKIAEPFVPDAVGGNQTGEDGWRNDFTNHGLYIAKPMVGSVTAGIQAIYGMFKTGRLRICSDLEKLIEEIEQYSYELDDNSDPVQDKIKDKSKYHRLDALRYVISEIVQNPGFGRAREIIPLSRPQEIEGHAEFYGR